jgi:hypothetical protein
MRGCDSQRRFVSHGELTPPLLCCCADACRRKNDFCDAQTHAEKERRASAHRGYRYRTCKGASTKSRRTAESVCADHRCIRVQRRRKGQSVVPAPALRDFQSLSSRAGFPRGADAPRSWLRCERLPAKNDFFDAQTHVRLRSGRREPAVGVRQTRLQHRYRTRSQTLVSCRNMRGARQPAVGVGNSFAQTQACLFGGPPTVCVRIAVAFASSGAARGRVLYQRRLCVIFSRCARVQGSHGGLTPPAPVLLRERLPAKKRFLRCTNARRKRAAGVSPPWVGKCASADMTAIRRQTAGGVCADRRYIRVDSCHGGLTPPALVLVYERLSAKKRFLRCTNARSLRSGGRQPAVAWSYDRCAARSECCSATSEHTAKSGGRQPAVGVGNSIAQMQACSFGGPPTVYVRIAVTFALLGSVDD